MLISCHHKQRNVDPTWVGPVVRVHKTLMVPIYGAGHAGDGCANTKGPWNIVTNQLSTLEDSEKDKKKDSYGPIPSEHKGNPS